MLLYRRLLVLAVVIVSLTAVFRARATEPSVVPSVAPPPAFSVDRPGRIQSLDDAKDVQDPRALVRAGDWHRGQGKLDLARSLYERAIDDDEFSAYFRGNADLREARVLEFLGDWPGAAEKYRASATRDPE